MSNKEAEDIDNEKKSDDSKTKSRKDSTESQKDSDADMDVENNPIASAATAAAAGTFKYLTFKLFKIFYPQRLDNFDYAVQFFQCIAGMALKKERA